ncbi:hypothetical protein [Actinomadura rupiterrae]|uniref:hypothetical protein n=1 Tax=Actinomadura rupiterrae TaxID=559627 RepID=UPI0020A2F616|nr:hypothetical protein [Actinomadura rupiterrae]MCP2339772.1 hypothetical protein [Actinomadura rupiterrae]
MRSWVKWLVGPEVDERRARLTGTALLVAALGLTVWIVYLGSALPDQGPAQDWNTTWTGIDTWQLTWVGLDVFEVAGLAATGWLLRGSHRETRTAALLAAPVFVIDGWFDMLTAASRSDLAVSLAVLALAELPGALVLLLVARKARQFEAGAPDERPDRAHAEHRALADSHDGGRGDLDDRQRR